VQLFQLDSTQHHSLEHTAAKQYANTLPMGLLVVNKMATLSSRNERFVYAMRIRVVIYCILYIVLMLKDNKSQGCGCCAVKIST
jgi:hypothetical protein